jgi:hypothetical protein
MTPYGISKDILDKGYMTALHSSLWTRLKFYFFGKKIVESAGMLRFVWYVYKDQLFLAEMKHKYL